MSVDQEFVNGVAQLNVVPGHTITVGHKCNSGKTTALLMLAVRLAKEGKRVVFLNGDRLLPEVLNNLVKAQDPQFAGSILDLGVVVVDGWANVQPLLPVTDYLLVDCGWDVPADGLRDATKKHQIAVVETIQIRV